MRTLRITVACLLAFVAIAACAPTFGGGWHGKHTHYVIHVPYHVHTIHKYHKVPVYVKTHTHTHTHVGGWNPGYTDWAGWD